MESAAIIKSVLEEKLCPIHDVHPVVEVIGDKVNIMCCCDYFYRYCTIEAEYMQAPHSIADHLVHVNKS